MSNICRLCLESDSEKYFRMDTAEYLPKIKSVVPEIDLEIVEEPFICDKCSQLLSSAYTFKTNCLLTNEELKTYAVDGNPIKIIEFLRQKNEEETLEDTLQDTLEDTLELSDPDDNLDFDTSDTKIATTDVPQFINFTAEVSETLIGTSRVEIDVNKTPIDKKKPTRHQKQRIVLNKCHKCNKIFLKRNFLEKHLRRHKQDNANRPKPNKANAVNKCEICKRVFLTKIGLATHIKSFKHYQCTVCNVLKPNRGTLVAHMNTHTGERPHQCSQCGKSFGQLSTLNTHIRSIHMTDRPYICEVCGMSFPVRGAYTAHIRRRHQPVEKKFVCSYCGKAFRIKSMLQTHVKWHTGERDVLCEVCNKGFVSKGSLTRHMRIHNGYKPFSCPICQKTFSQNNNMKIHLKSCSQRETTMSDVKVIQSE